MKSPGRFPCINDLYILILMLFCLGILSPSCKKEETKTPVTTTPTPNPTPGANEVWMSSSAFSPATITVAVNTTIKWTNKDGMDHTVTSNTNLFDSGIIASGGTYSRNFTTSGTFPYKCTLHSGMTGTVIVN
jgi:plastocyanin